MMRTNELVQVLTGLFMFASLECGKSDQWVIETIKMLKNDDQCDKNLRNDWS